MTTTAVDSAKPKKILQFFPAETAHPRRLTTARVQAYNERGYLSPLTVFDESEARANRELFDRLMVRAEECGWDRYSINGWHYFCRRIYDLVIESRILDIVEDLVGPNILCVGTHFFCKSPGDLKRVTWHQDAPYYQLSPSKSLTAWLAIDDVDEENGAMQVIPRSHLRGEIGAVPSAADEQNVLTHTVRGVEACGDAAVSIILRAGQISLHSDMLLHGSEPNPSGRRRCGLAIRYLPTDVRALTDWNRISVICRGTDPSGHWANNPRPATDLVPIKPKNDGGFWDITDTVPL